MNDVSTDFVSVLFQNATKNIDRMWTKSSVIAPIKTHCGKNGTFILSKYIFTLQLSEGQSKALICVSQWMGWKNCFSHKNKEENRVAKKKHYMYNVHCFSIWILAKWNQFSLKTSFSWVDHNWTLEQSVSLVITKRPKGQRAKRETHTMMYQTKMLQRRQKQKAMGDGHIKVKK